MPEEEQPNPLEGLNSLIEKSEGDEHKQRLLKRIKSAYIQTILLPANKQRGELMYSTTMSELYDEENNLLIELDDNDAETLEKYVDEIEDALYPKGN